MTNQMSTATVVDFPSITDVLVGAKPSIERVNKVKHSQGQLHKIQADLEVLIDSMAKNPSMLSRLANYWGKLPLWQKIIAGVVLVAPPLIIGILAQLIVCFVITGFLLAAYIGGSVALDDHYSHTTHSTKNIKSGVTSLAEGLDAVTNTLEEISADLSAQVAIFTSENERFGDNVDVLKLRNITLGQEVEKLKTTEGKLKLTQEELETACNELKDSVKDQTSLLEQTQVSLNQVKIDFARNQKELEDKNKELADLHKQLKIEVTRYEQLLETLQKAVNELAMTLLKTPEEQEQFYKTLKDFIQDKDSSFLKTSERYSQEVKELTALKDQYKSLVAVYEGNIKKQNSHLDRIEKASSLLDNHGLYATASSGKKLELPTMIEPPRIQ